VGGRRPELDLIRLVVVLGLVFFHAGLVFDTRDDFYVKNSQTTEAVTWVAGLGVVWAMPALFLIAGLGSWHSIRRRGAGGFVRERLLRLGVPLVFATLTIVPVPQWLRFKAAGYDGSYWQFLGQFFDVRLSLSNVPFLVRGEYFETGHLWFVVLLLTFSLLLALFARWWPAPSAAVLRRGLILLPAVPFAVIGAVLGMEEAFAGWSRWAYLLFFLCGFVLAGDERLRVAMRRDARVAAVAGLVLFGGAGWALGWAGGEPFTDMTAKAILARVLFGAAGWFWLVAILGLLDRPTRDAPPPSPADAPPSPVTAPLLPGGGPLLPGGGPLLPADAPPLLGGGPPAPGGGRAAPGGGPVAPGGGRAVLGYLGAAALPLYVLHQPIVVVVAYFVVRWQLPMPLKYLVIVAISFAVMLAVYDLGVRRTRVTRFLFGMRSRPAAAG
jgi:peptidoglycan/LPS O-acetylase OafA/YrhL